jgi:hypothetical protein
MFVFLLFLLAALVAEEGSRSSSKPRLILYAPQLNSNLIYPFRSPRQNRQTLPSHRQLSTHRQTTHTIFIPLALCNAQVQPPLRRAIIAVFPASLGVERRRSHPRRPPMGPTDPANGRRAPIDSESPTSLPGPLRCWTWSPTSSMLCSSGICLPSTPPAPPFRSSKAPPSSLAPPDARRTAWFSSATAPTRRPPRSFGPPRRPRSLAKPLGPSSSPQPR